MTIKRKTLAAVGAVALAVTATPGLAQGTGDTGTTYPTTQENDDDFPWGLLGLLGLAGLLGLKGRDRDDNRVDTTRR